MDSKAEPPTDALNEEQFMAGKPATDKGDLITCTFRRLIAVESLRGLHLFCA